MYKNKYFIILLLLILSITKSIGQSPYCKLLTLFLSDSIFYGNYGVNNYNLLGRADTIWVIDTNTYFKGCGTIKIKRPDSPKWVDWENIGQKDLETDSIVISINNMNNAKTARKQIKNSDDLKKYNQSFQYYIFIESITINNALVRIKFYKYVTNHSGWFEYKYEGDDLIRERFEVGQY